MTREALLRLLQEVRSGTASPEQALDRISWLPVETVALNPSESPVARTDHHRVLRQGHPEVVFCQGKTEVQVLEICRRLAARGSGFLATRAEADVREALSEAFPGAVVSHVGRVVHLPGEEALGDVALPILVASAGTSDVPVAEEAAFVAEALGNRVERLYDVGVSGIHRILREADVLQRAGAVIVVAGMEGALPSVVGGLVAVPVIAVPTSVGYGASFGGVTALLAMLNSCAAGVTVVNIDNGFGAAFAATRIPSGGPPADSFLTNRMGLPSGILQRASRLPGVRRRVGGVPLGPLRLVAAGAYVVGLVLAPAVPPLLLVVLSALALALVVAAWAGDGRLRAAGEALWLWPSCHLAIVATGAMGSPLLPLFPGWLFLLVATGDWVWAVAGAAMATPVLLAAAVWVGRWDTGGAVEVVLLAAFAIAAARFVHAMRLQAADERRALARILTEAEAGADSPPEAAAAGRLEQLEWSLAGVRRRIGAGRVIIWLLHRDQGLAVAELVTGGQSPGEVALAAAPFDWVRREQLTVRLDAPPSWAPGAGQVWLARLPGRPDQEQVLSAEFSAEFDSPAALEEEAAFLGTVLRIQGREARAVAVRAHLERVLEVLRRLSRQVEPAALARELAASAIELAAGTGAAVTRWDETTGTVLTVLGDDGGPMAGAEFGGLDSETSLAIRSEAAIVRDRRRALASPTPVVTRNERWYSDPSAVAAYPLIDGQGVVGAVTVWSGHRPNLDAAGLSVLETILPHAAFQFRYALDSGRMREDADTDPLTGLRNRRYLEERFRSECARAVRYQRRLALLILDIDHFKSINDTYGHEAGDAVLRATGAFIAASVRDADVTARYGGEEFVVLMPETGLAEGIQIAERLRRVLAAREISHDGRSIALRVSIGVSAFPECVDEPESLTQSADEALYAAKSAGRNRVVSASRVADS